MFSLIMICNLLCKYFTFTLTSLFIKSFYNVKHIFLKLIINYNKNHFITLKVVLVLFFFAKLNIEI